MPQTNFLREWRGATIPAAIILASLVLYRDSVTGLVAFWDLSFVYNYGGLVFVCLAILPVVELRHHRPFVRPLPFAAGVALTIGLALVFASIAKIMLAEMLLLPALWLALFWMTYGFHAVRKLIFPYCLIALALPVWDVLIGPLQLLTVRVSSFLLEMTGRTALIQGDTVYLAYGSFVVERGCSGLNYLLAGGILGGAYAYALLHGVVARAIAIAAAALLAMMANWIRVYLIVLIGDLSEMQHGIVEEHIGFGWIVFGVVMSLLFFIGPAIQRSCDRLAAADTSAPGAPLHSPSPINLSACAVLVLVLVVPPASAAAAVTRGSGADLPAHALPATIGSWSRTTVAAPEAFAPVFEMPVDRQSAVYENQGMRVFVWVHRYRFAPDAPELVGYPNAWFHAGKWRVTRDVSAADLRSPKLRSQVLSGDAGDRLLGFGYRIAGHATASAVQAKLYRAIAILSGRPYGSALTVSAACSDQCGDEVPLFGEFLAQIDLALEPRQGDPVISEGRK